MIGSMTKCGVSRFGRCMQVGVAAVLLLAATGAPSSHALTCHRWHWSTTEIQRNAQTSNLEVAMCVWTDDAQEAISKLTPQPLQPGDAKFDAALKQYVSDRFEITVSGEAQRSPIRWVGHQVVQNRIWIFFEIKGAAQAESWIVTNKIFADIEPEQENTVSVSESNLAATIVCHPGGFTQTLTLNRTAKPNAKPNATPADPRRQIRKNSGLVR